jgi:protein-S-isoprenylcysteine O-methyltransferase Ste14
MDASIRSMIALALLALWVILAFFIRVMVHRARTGSPGINLISPDARPVELIAGLLFIGALVAAPVSAVLHAVLPGALRLPAGWTAPLGIAVMCTGIYATVVSQRAMGKSWRIGVDPTERTDLVTSGVFGHVRNPIYSAMLLTAVGLLLLVPNLVTVGMLILSVTAVELQVRAVEEPYLARLHGDAYLDYCRSVGRFIPGVGLSGPSPG